MDSKIYTPILKTVCYADIFDYPLKEGEVDRFLCHPAPPQNDMAESIKKANGVIVHKNNFMFLKGRDGLIEKRLEREKISEEKLTIAQQIVKILKRIPTIKLIGVSGSVAVDNAKEADDIDLFIITSHKTIWLTRLLATIAVELFSKRRHPGDQDVKDKICLNMFVDERSLAIPSQNFYTAHEVCQLKVLYERDNTYQKFLIANEWVRKYLPNAIVGIRNKESGIRKRKPLIRNSLFIILEFLAKHLQLWYMRNRLTTETISEGYLAFHPRDYTDDIVTAFEKKVAAYAAKV